MQVGAEIPGVAEAGEAGDDGRPTLRLCSIPRPSTGSCGFHISRTQWDPYPWVSAVEAGSPADRASLRAGDCVLEVNGEDVLGQRIGEVAAKVRAQERLQLLVWNAGCDPSAAVTLTAGSGPTPLNLHLLSSCLRQVGQLLECPVCLEAVSPPVWQCCHGHLLCSGCRARSDRCPLCRVPLGPRGRSLLADQLHGLLMQTHRRYSDQRHGRHGLVPQGVDAGVDADDDKAVKVPTLVVEDADDAAQTDTNEPRAHVLMRGLRLTASTEDVTSEAGPTTPTPTLTATTLDVPGRVPGRARSLSAGQLSSLGVDAEAGDKPRGVDGDLGGRVYCPYGSACTTTCAPSEVFNHLREDHVGPMMQYFPREGRELSLPHPGGRWSGAARKASDGLTVLTTKAGDTMFLHAERGCMWLWTLPTPASPATSPTACPTASPFTLSTSSTSSTTSPTTTAPDSEAWLNVAFTDDAALGNAPVFSLSISSDEAIASGRCVRVPEHEGSRMSVSVQRSLSTPGTPVADKKSLSVEQGVDGNLAVRGASHCLRRTGSTPVV